MPRSGIAVGNPVVTVSEYQLAPNLEEACRRWAERPAVTFREVTMSYRELWKQVARLARSYLALGVQPGDRIVCQLRNCPEHVVAINAAWGCGAIHAGTDNDLTGGELAWLIQHLEAKVLVYQPPPNSADPMEPVRAVLAARPETIVLWHDDAPSGDRLTPALVTARLSKLLGDVDGDAPFAPRYRGPEETGLLLLTSGTTGRPKAVMETLPACWSKMQFFADAFGPQPDDVHLLFLPMAHVFGLRLSQLALLRGGRLVLLDRFSPTAALRLIRQEGVTVLPGMPTHLTLLLQSADLESYGTTRLRWVISAAANLPRDLVESIYERFGSEILYVYGCSENFTVETTVREDILDGSVGRLVFAGPAGEPPDGTIRIVSPDDRAPLPPGAVGEIAFGARRPVHYWGSPDSAVDGWYYTGDLGRIDDRGRVFVLGRLKELVNRGGLKVSPSEIEAAIALHPGVVDAAVVGTPDPVLGEAICACVVAAPGESIDLVSLRSFLAQTLARHKLPDELALVEQIPRTKIGKVDRPGLVARVAAAGGPNERLRPRPREEGVNKIDR